MYSLALADEGYNPLSAQQTSEQKIGLWKRRELHGAHAQMLSQEYIDCTLSNLWLRHGSLFPETEGFAVAIQDRVIATKVYRKRILQEHGIDDRCRRCREAPETIEHIIAGCSSLARVEYLKRHNDVAKINPSKNSPKIWFPGGGVPLLYISASPVLENDKAKIYWDRSIRTDLTIMANRPDVMMLDKKKKIAFLIDVAIPLNHNLRSTQAEKSISMWLWLKN
ncbi:hypothetical protein LSTR_LSTR015404 [Laodelphax striatellus]|uniref:Reverse transcriptase zinc-binding domain-containing protein n=1 Tax=Laodelphax striatellus TaxID=195883 RepID=A0A482WIZ3_LAOST|nr:hypothetical protein LSTR_LSTR015404 [Laodelphax striatellus]